FRSQGAGDIYTYNAPGVGGPIGNIVDAFRSIFGLGGAAVSGITNVRGTGGTSLISGIGLQLAPPTLIETETYSNSIDNHRIHTITDSLALYRASSDLRPGLT